jgi:hypothetical protein
MDPRTVTTKNKSGTLVVVTRELLGKDRVALRYVRAALVDAIYPRYGWKKASEMENAVYVTITGVADVIVQTVSLEGDWPEGLILPDAADYPACLALHDRLQELPDRYMELLLKGVSAANEEPENPTGESGAQKSQSGPSVALTVLAAQ